MAGHGGTLSFWKRSAGDPNNPEHDEMIEWIGEDFDPEEFDVDETSELLANHFGQRRAH